MANLTTTYMGIELRSPIIVGASNLVLDIENVRRIEKAGAGAIVYKSLFEEQIQLEMMDMDDSLSEYDDRHAEMTNIFPNIQHAGPADHLFQLEKLRRVTSIPVIASINAVYDVSWVDYAIEIANTGVAGIELNFYTSVDDAQRSGDSIISDEIEIIKKIRRAVNIPLSVKISPFYTNIMGTVARMDKEKIGGVVLFNRLFQPAIDIEKEEHFFPWNLSHEGDNRLSLRYAGLLYDNIKADICCNTGIFTGNDAVQMLLAGASSVQVVSALYKHKIEHITDMNNEITAWMNRKGYKKIEDFRGKLSRKHTQDPYTYKRAQYVDILFNSQNIFEKYPVK